MINSADLENTCCPLCHSAEKQIAYEFAPYAVVRCSRCGLYYLLPRLRETAMLQLYADGTYFESEKVGYASYIEQEAALRATFRRFLVNLDRRNLTGGTLLDVGCGYGYLLEEAKEFFDFRVGTDFSHQAVQDARQRADRVYEGDVNQIPANDKFDCIVTFNVIEHVYNPKAFLEDICKHLKPGGKIAIATPNMGSFWRRLMGHRWPSFKLPEHVLFFDERRLSALMHSVGLVGIRRMPCPHAFPLSLIADKLNIRLPPMLGKFVVWLPAVMIAMYGFSLNE